jgi:hypothetical protein
LWGTWGTDAWYLGPSVDHYQCNHYFVPKTGAYRISGSTKLFPQHCQVPYMSAKDQLQEVTKEMISTLTKMPANEQRRVLTEVHAKLADDSLHPCGLAFLTSPCHAWMLPNNDHQRAPQEAAPTRVPAPEGQQRVGPTPEVTPADSLQRMSNAPPIMNVPNPTTRQALKSTKHVNLRLTRNNVPGTVPHNTYTTTILTTDSNQNDTDTPITMATKNAPTNGGHKSPSTMIPQTPTRPNCRPCVQPQHHQPTSFTYTCRQCVRQLQPQFYTKKPMAKGKNRYHKF